MLDQLASIVGNGTTAGGWGYQPGFPFYNFFSIIVLVSVLMTLALYLIGMTFTRAVLGGALNLTSGLSAVGVVFVLWVKLDLNPSQVFFWWAVNWILMMLGQLYYIRTNERVKEQIKDMEDRVI